MRPSYRARWLQFLLILMLVTTQRCNAQSASEKRWDKADLIVEGRITETTTENGIQISKLAVDRILKTETLASEPYSKGYVENLILHVPANTLAQHQTLRFFIEENQGTYRLLAAEQVENPAQTPYMNSGSYGFIILIVIAWVASQRPLILPENKE